MTTLWYPKGQIGMFVLYFHKVKDIELIPVYNIPHELITVKWPVIIINILSSKKCSWIEAFTELKWC